MKQKALTAISPVDGRYRNTVKELAGFFSEYALIRYRVFVEIEYFIALGKIPLPQLKHISTTDIENLRAIHKNFSIHQAERIKEIEKVTNHDVKAVEYFLKEELDKQGLSEYREFVHFGLTSQDINNTALPLSIHEALDRSYYPALEKLMTKIRELAGEWMDIPMLARTHGQPASPTKVGKELMVFHERLEVQLAQLKTLPCFGKFGGATGNFNAHVAAYPHIDWPGFANRFLKETLGLERSQYTTQIAHYDNYGAIFDALKRINTILMDMNRDIWAYISLNYFKQKIKKGETGSSTMPHKVNPIDFENSEGNLGIANASFKHLSSVLPVSRMQRDLTDSTVTRFIGVPFAHTLLAFHSALRGLDKLRINTPALHQDLENNWAVVGEAIQTILRREKYPHPYEALKELTRTETSIDRQTIIHFVNNLPVSETVKNELKKITPHNYTGIF
jgi:adenylosuccinate lyase